jgi:very-short-patch-repair endonuclease
MKARRRELRKNQTKQEKVIWDIIRSGEFVAYRFRRQYSIGGFVIDFYCPSLKLAIEIDGSIHDSQVKYDAFRQAGIETLGIQFLRFTNDEIDNELGEVIKKIHKEIKPQPAYGIMQEKKV